MGLVSELDDHDAPVLGHRDDHRALVLRLDVRLGGRPRLGLALLPNSLARLLAAQVAQRGLLAARLGAHHLRQLGDLGLALDDPPRLHPEERVELSQRERLAMGRARVRVRIRVRVRYRVRYRVRVRVS